MTDSTSANQLRDHGRFLDRLLSRQLGRLRKRFFVHGLGYVLSAAVLALLIFYGLDRSLRLPTIVRVVLTLGATLAVVLILRRRVLYPMGRSLARIDMALALERTFPDLRSSLVSAFQLKDSLESPETSLRNQSPAMIGQLVDEAANQVRRLPVDRVLDGRRTARVWALTATLGLAGVFTAVQAGDSFGIFLQRMLGMDVGYPRATTLHVELPPASDSVQIERDGRFVQVTVASQSDLHVTVRAEGEIPRDVNLVVSSPRGEREVATTPRSEGRFRHVFRRVSGSFTFFARGGDDDRGDLEVTITTIEPPLVASILARVTPPAYTGSEALEQRGGAVEAMLGSAVDLDISPTAEVVRGAVVFEESGQRIDLQPTPPEEGDGPPLWRARFTVQGNDRYRVELVGDSGLSNPQSGSYAVVALPDFPPVGRVLAPVSSMALLPTAILPFRAHVEDDWGLTKATLTIQTLRDDDDRTFDLGSDGALGKSAYLLKLVPLTEVFGTEPDAAATGGPLTLVLDLADNRAPAPQTSELSPRRATIVDPGQLASRIYRTFRDIRESAESALDVQVDRLDRLEEIIETFEAEGLGQNRGQLSSIEVGQGRVRSLLNEAHEDLMRAFDLHLFNGMEGENPTQMMAQRYAAFHTANPSRDPQVPEFYRSLLEARQSGGLAAMPRALDPILAMFARADRLTQRYVPDVMTALTEAQVAQDSDSVLEFCRAARDGQKSILSDLNDLLERLREWNDFQDVIQETRALRDKQRDIQTRTKEIQGR